MDNIGQHDGGILRFAADVMLGRTARWLRLLGRDTFYSPDIADDALLMKSLLEHRMLLTRDTRLARYAGAAVYLVRANDLWAQLREICNHFAIEPKLSLDICPLCNGMLRAVAKDAVVDRVPRYTFLTHNEFYECGACGQIYWEGSHIKFAEADILQKLIGTHENGN